MSLAREAIIKSIIGWRHMKRTALRARGARHLTHVQEIQSIQRRLALLGKLERILKDHTAALLANRPAIHLLRTTPSGRRSENDLASCRLGAAPLPKAVVSRGLTKSRQGFSGSGIWERPSGKIDKY